MKKTHDYIHYYRGYWSEGGKCRIRIYREVSRVPVVICSQLPDNENTSVTNMAEYLAAEVIEKRDLPSPLVWVEHYPEHEGDIRGVLVGEVLQLGSPGSMLRWCVSLPGRVAPVVTAAP